MEPVQEQFNNHPKQKTNSFKTKLAFFFGYNGESFQGMQYQREHTNTIQNILHAVLTNNAFILPSNAGELKKIKWSRGARTDKRVHALCNGVSMKIEISPKYVKEGEGRQINYRMMINDLNSELPMDVRIMSIKKVAKHFDMRHGAKTRIYNYIIPSKMFQPYQNFKQGKKVEGEALKETVENLNSLVKSYLGTHNFYNFTRGYKRTNPQCTRYMISMKVEQVEKDTIENLLLQKNKAKKQQENDCQYESFIRFTLVGQSFIYHQIRKMIGLLVKIFAEKLNGQEAIKMALASEQYDVFLAPGEGLYLNRLTFQSYNNKKDTKEKLFFTEEEEECIADYRSYLEKRILTHQMEGKVFSDWLQKRVEYKQEGEEEEERSEEEND